MDWRKDFLKQLAAVAVGLIIGTGAMFGIFALLGAFHSTVLLGGIAGAVIALVNFIAMAVSAMRAANKAAAQEVKAGQLMIQGSYLLRLVVLFGVLFLLAKTQHFHVISLVVPLIFVRPALSVWEIFRKQSEVAS